MDEHMAEQFQLNCENVFINDKTIMKTDTSIDGSRERERESVN